jgi:hypothetical protein
MTNTTPARATTRKTPTATRSRQPLGDSTNPVDGSAASVGSHLAAPGSDTSTGSGDSTGLKMASPSPGGSTLLP